jgi:hypothetical protein
MSDAADCAKKVDLAALVWVADHELMSDHEE